MRRTNLLKLDIDFKPSLRWLIIWRRERVIMLEKMGYDVDHISIVPSSKRGIHVFIKLAKKITARTANMLQWLCGDDPSRVDINNWRIERGIENWNILFGKVIYRKDGGYIVCHYCQNKIPLGIIKKQLTPEDLEALKNK